MLARLEQVVIATAPYAVAFKPNLAFYEAMGSVGWRVLGRVIRRIRSESPRAMVILDGKRGDIGSSTAAYARAGVALDGDAITVSPFMGPEAAEPFLEAGMFAFLVAAPTSLRSGRMLDHGEPPLYLEVGRMAIELDAAHGGRVGLVVGATRPDRAARLHGLSPALPWLVPGVGAQGGELSTLRQAAPGHLLLVNASRSILGAADPGLAARELAACVHGAQGGTDV